MAYVYDIFSRFSFSLFLAKRWCVWCNLQINVKRLIIFKVSYRVFHFVLFFFLQQQHCYLGLTLRQLVRCNVNVLVVQGVSRFHHSISSCCECFDILLTTYLHTLLSNIGRDDYIVSNRIVYKLLQSNHWHCFIASAAQTPNNGLFNIKQYKEIIYLLFM